MNLKCRLRLHNWKNWSLTPMTQDGGRQWFAGQLRQCADCWFVQVETFAPGTAFNPRPLREAVRKHLAALDCANGDLPEGITAEAANLRVELQKDEGRPA